MVERDGALGYKFFIVLIFYVPIAEGTILYGFSI
jgi:hypothetical protein